MKVYLFIAAFIFLDVIDDSPISPISSCSCTDDYASSDHTQTLPEVYEGDGGSAVEVPADTVRMVPTNN